jgi:VanZ family protein
MGLIYWASASPYFQAVLPHQDPSVVQPWFGPALVANPDLFHLIQLLVRKSAHLIAFGVLAILARWTLAALWPRLFASRLSAAALLFTIIYAITDEWHQAFVPGREGRVGDVLIDSVGALIGVSLAQLRQKGQTTL